MEPDDRTCLYIYIYINQFNTIVFFYKMALFIGLITITVHTGDETKCEKRHFVAPKLVFTPGAYICTRLYVGARKHIYGT